MSPEGSPEGFASASASASATGVVLARPDVSTLRTKQGAWIGVGGASFTVKGGSAFQVVSTLLTRADGSRSGRELVDEFPAGARPAVSRVLDALVARRCVAVLDAPLARQVEAKGPAAEWLLPHLAQLTDAPVRALDRLLATTLRLYGRPDWLDRLRGLLEAAPLAGLRTEFHALTAADPEPQLPGNGDGAGDGVGHEWVVLDADGLPHERVVRLQDALLARGVPHGITGEVAGRRWILWSDDAATGCWECLCRYGRTAPAAAPADEDALAATLVQALYLRAAGLGGTAAAAVSLELASGQPIVTDHQVWSAAVAAGCRCHRALNRPNVTGRPAPGAARDDAGEVLVRRNIVSPEDDSRLDDVHERIVDTLRGWTDEFAGPFRHLDGGDLTQVPFGQARATALVGLGEACRVHELVAATLSPREAIYQAALNAVERFASPASSASPTPPASSVSPVSPASPVATAVGAGWALEEAVYRALLTWSLARPPELSSWVRLTDDDLGHGECASFARYIQRAVDRRRDRDRGNESDRDREPLRWTGTRLPNGIHRVTGRTAGGPVVRGAGVCYGEAVAMALLGLVNDDGALVPLNPHFRTWPEVWRQIARPEFAEVTERTVPFAHGKVRLVEVV